MTFDEIQSSERPLVHGNGGVARFNLSQEGHYVSDLHGQYMILSKCVKFVHTNKEWETLEREHVVSALLTKLGFDSIGLVNSLGDIEKLSMVDKDSFHVIPAMETDKKIDCMVGPFFHATNQYFSEFCHGDIGFHFGTRKAALQRAKVLDRPEVQIVEESLSKGDERLYQLLNSSNSSLKQKALNLIGRKITNPNLQRIEGALSSMTEVEVAEVIEEYNLKSDSKQYQRIASMIDGGVTHRYLVEIDCNEIAMTSKKELTVLSSSVNESYMKKAFLNITNPYRMEDMGTWGLQGVLSKVSVLTKEERTEISSMSSTIDDSAALNLFHKIMLKHGFDGIVYRNEVEDIGKDSYIAFYPSQICQVPHKEKLFGQTVEFESRDCELTM
ncbi:hypothetical protein [Vibrio harveyi]|uniref:hypothetical protein n=1 Tax=Vibrio harveyi TaxID=669 RepID=UPI003CF98D20